MPAPTTYSFTDSLNVGAQNLVLSDLDAGSSAGKIDIYSEDDTVLLTITLTDPAGTVDTAGQLNITAASDGTGIADKTATWGRFTDSDGNKVLDAPVVEGSSVVSGKIVLSTTTIATGSNVTLISATVG